MTPSFGTPGNASELAVTATGPSDVASLSDSRVPASGPGPSITCGARLGLVRLMRGSTAPVELPGWESTRARSGSESAPRVPATGLRARRIKRSGQSNAAGHIPAGVPAWADSTRAKTSAHRSDEGAVSMALAAPRTAWARGVDAAGPGPSTAVGFPRLVPSPFVNPSLSLAKGRPLASSPFEFERLAPGLLLLSSKEAYVGIVRA